MNGRRVSAVLVILAGLTLAACSSGGRKAAETCTSLTGSLGFVSECGYGAHYTGPQPPPRNGEKVATPLLLLYPHRSKDCGMGGVRLYWTKDGYWYSTDDVFHPRKLSLASGPTDLVGECPPK
jgi:hypothetical protein